jgi:hypothetical protein
MTAQVVFISNFYYPTEIERVRLEWLQEQMDLYQAELEMLSRDFTEFQKFVFKETSYNKLRKTWRLILVDSDQD